MAPRPRLKPYFRPIRRGVGTVQLGLSGESGGIIVSGLAPAEVALLERLDGPQHDGDLDATARRFGVDGRRAAELLELLDAHGVLLSPSVDGEDLGDLGGDSGRPARRAARRAVVDGSGPLPPAIAALLRSSGVGRVDLGPWAADIVDAELRSAPGSRPDLVVLVGQGGLDARTGEPWRRRGVPLLPVLGDGVRVVVGPLVGADSSLPCLGCLELTRVDRDAAWPRVLAQANRRSAQAGGDDLAASLVSLAAGVVAMVSLASLAGDVVPAGVSVEVGLPWPRLDHRRWERHPGCPAHRPSRAAGLRSVPPTAGVTMTG